MFRQHAVLSTTHAAESQNVVTRKNASSQYQQSKERRRLNVCDPQQTLITKFYQLTSNIAHQVNTLASENQHLKMLIRDYQVQGAVRGENLHNQEKLDSSSTTEFLNEIWKIVEAKNRTRHGKIKQYDDQIKQFSTYLYIIAGKLAYETLSSNLSLPSVATIKKEIQSANDAIVEGEIRSISLKQFIVKRKLRLQVWLSEDATKIANKIECDSTTDQIIGLVLPMDAHGNPVPYTFLAKNVATMQQSLLDNPKADYVYTVMARSLDVNAPSFFLQLFGTDNKFTTGMVLKRWSHTERVLSSEEIEVLGWSSDGDTRCLRAMLIRSGLPCVASNAPRSWQEWFNAFFKPDMICVQDTHHITSKFRNRLYDHTAVIALGNYIVSKSHLQILIDNVSKDKHLLVPSDLRPYDKMNFKPVLKIMNPAVRSLLKEHVAASLGTSIYLGLMENIYKSYEDDNLEPLERVYKL